MREKFHHLTLGRHTRLLAVALVTGAAATVALLLAGSQHGAGGSAAVQGALYSPGGEAGEVSLAKVEQYWQTRLTYPTGRFNQRWVTGAAKQAQRIKSGIPKGHYKAWRGTRSVTGSHGAQSIKALAAARPLGPQPQVSTGCQAPCFTFGLVSGRVSAIAFDPAHTNVAYLAQHGRGQLVADARRERVHAGVPGRDRRHLPAVPGGLEGPRRPEQQQESRRRNEDGPVLLVRRRRQLVGSLPDQRLPRPAAGHHRPDPPRRRIDHVDLCGRRRARVRDVRAAEPRQERRERRLQAGRDPGRRMPERRVLDCADERLARRYRERRRVQSADRPRHHDAVRGDREQARTDRDGDRAERSPGAVRGGGGRRSTGELRRSPGARLRDGAWLLPRAVANRERRHELDEGRRSLDDELPRGNDDRGPVR